VKFWKLFIFEVASTPDRSVHRSLRLGTIPNEAPYAF